MAKLPVTVLSGFLGSGKTTLLKKILSQSHGKKIAVIVNDMAEVNIDAALVAQGELRQVEQKMVQMTNGCICCTLREDLIQEVTDIARKGDFEYLVIESTGIGEPMQVAEAFSFDLEEDKYGLKQLTEVAELDTLVTVVDAENFDTYIGSKEVLSTLVGEDVPEEDERSIAHLLVDQIECANVILLNKRDRVSAQKIATITEIIKQLNPDAQLYETVYASIELDNLLNTHLYDVEKTASMPGWMKDLEGEMVPETEEYGISSFVYRARRPFHPQRFYTWTQQFASEWSNCLRSKGFIWIATRNNTMGEWATAGPVVNVKAAQQWLACCDQGAWPIDTPHEEIKKIFDADPFIGDRRQEVVFIGQKMDKQKMIQQLTQCCLTADEFSQGPGVWSEWDDPMDEWEEEDPHHHGEEQTGAALTTAVALISDGKTSEARELLQELQMLIQYNLACCDVKDGYHSAAVEHLQKAIELGFSDADHLLKDEDMKPLHEDVSFQALLKELEDKGKNNKNKCIVDEDEEQTEEPCEGENAN